MSMFEQTRWDAAELLDEAREALDRADRPAERDLVRERWSRLIEGTVSCVVCGEFKRGKSSLLGALIEDPRLFPVDIDIATSLVSSVEFGPDETVTAYVTEGGRSSPVVIDRDRIAEFVTEQGNPDNARQVQLLRIQTPIERLRSGLVLLDTPGAGGLNTSHTAVTHGVIGSADVAIFVVDALTPLTTDELSLLTTVSRQAARLIVVVTKIDRVMDPETAVRNAQLKISETLGEDVAGRIPVIPVSSAAKLDWLRTGDSESLEASNFGRLESTLWSLLTEQGGSILISRALGGLVHALDDVVVPLRGELTALTGTDAELQTALAEVRAEEDRLADLAGTHAEWRRSLVRAFEEMRDRMQGQLDREVGTIQTTLDERLAAPDVLQKDQQLIADLERDVTVAWSELVDDLRSSAAALGDSVEASTGLRLNSALERGGTVAAADMFTLPPRSADDESGAFFVALDWVGEIVSLLLDDVTVAIVTELIGFFGVRRAKSRSQRVDFADEIRSQLTNAHRELGVRLGDLVGSAEASMTASFDEVIAADRGRAVAARAAMRTEPVDAPAREERLRTTIAEMTALRGRATAIVDRLTAPAWAVREAS